MLERNWVEITAEQISLEILLRLGDVNREQVESRIVELIKEHCPFKPDVAYEEAVDRTAYALQLLKNSGIDTTCGACMEISFTGVTQAAHTCPPKPDPLLQCIDCHNTESPAGAMARYFNHGRCLHCGGFFKVVRA
jgi:hypothetical protein